MFAGWTVVAEVGEAVAAAKADEEMKIIKNKTKALIKENLYSFFIY